MSTRAPHRVPQQRRHTTRTVQTAHQMYDHGEGWTPGEIARYLTERGTPVAEKTVRLWVVPGAAERHSQWQRRSRRRRSGQSLTPFLDDMRSLREQGLSYRGIGRALGYFRGRAFSEDQVRYYLSAGVEPKPVKA